MDWMSIVLKVVYAYLAIWIAKSILALADAHVAAGVSHRKTGRPTWQLLAGIVIGILVITLLMWPKLLVEERWRFFLTYSRFSVIRQVTQAYRDADASSSEKEA
jgi:hypothetical protein